MICLINVSFSFTFSENVFTDPDEDDSLYYTATLSDNNPLPLWLSFEANTRTFMGIPGISDIDTITIKVTATDDSSANISDEFILEILDINSPPEISTLPRCL